MRILRKIHRFFVDNAKTFKLQKYYCVENKTNNDKNGKTIISMVDGRMKHGGLSDRLSGIVSAFQYCSLNHVDFKINFIYPYDLRIFLLPNEYDWSIDPQNITYNNKISKPLYISLYSHHVDLMRKYANAKLKLKCSQIHLYSNMYYFQGNEFGFYFNKLFKKTKILEDALNANLSAIGEKYVTVTFRFQQLLGDFKEPGFSVLESELEQKKLIEKCLPIVEMVYERERKKVVVTSDSQKFLKIAQEKFDFVYIIPGTIVHMDCVKKDENIDVSTHLKSFVDFFVLANADTVYLANISPLYSSSFPKLASMVYNKKFVEISNKPQRFFDNHERLVVE